MLRDFETRRLVGKICDKLDRESNDGESDHEEARVSRNLFDLFEQTDRAEEAVATAAWGMDQGTEREQNRDTVKNSKGVRTPLQRETNWNRPSKAQSHT